MTTFGAMLPLLAMAILLAGVVIRRLRFGLVDPVALGSATLLWYYVADTLFIVADHQSSGQYGLSRRIFSYSWPAVATGVVLVVTFCLGWLSGCAIARPSAPAVEAKGVSMVPPGRFAMVGGAGILAVGVVLLVGFIIQQGGFVWYLANIAARASIFKDVGAIWALLQAITIAASILGGIVLALHPDRRVAWAVGGGLLCGGAALLALLMGARANVARVVAIGASMWHFLRAPLLPKRRVLYAAIGGLGLLVAFARLTRPSEGESGLGSFFNSVETSQGNAILLITADGRAGEVKGTTLAAAVLSFIPRAALEAIGLTKPRGGNWYFTSTYWADRWNRTHSEVSIGIGGELLLNLGLWGPGAGGVLLGLLVVGVQRIIVQGLAGRRRWVSGVLNAALLWFTFQVLRGDLFNAINNLVVFGLGAVLVAVLLGSDLRLRAMHSR